MAGKDFEEVAIKIIDKIKNKKLSEIKKERNCLWKFLRFISPISGKKRKSRL